MAFFGYRVRRKKELPNIALSGLPLLGAAFATCTGRLGCCAFLNTSLTSVFPASRSLMLLCVGIIQTCWSNCKSGCNMENLKKLTLFMITTIVTVFLIIWSLRSFGFHSPIAALVVNWMILSSIATVTLLAHLSFPSVYYDAKPFGYVAVNGWLDALI